MSKSKQIILITMVLVAAAIGAYYWYSIDHHKGPDFTQYPAGKARKQAFFDYFAPIAQSENQKLLALRQDLLDRITKVSLSQQDKKWLSRLAKQYKFKKFTPDNPQSLQALAERIDIVPVSLVLAQSANESAWGTSRFAVQGNNYFGQWCFTKGCGLVPQGRDAGASHEVAKFDSPRESVEEYLYNINVSNAYQELRAMRAERRALNQPIHGEMLAQGLGRYSERGDEYIEEIVSMIQYNGLSQYDE